MLLTTEDNLKLQTVTGQVKHGEKVGRTIGFPTANLDVHISEADLKPGVYLVRYVLESSSENGFGLAYFGPRHIFGEVANVFEVFLYDFDQTIYGQTLTVTLLEHMRDPEKIGSLEELQSLLNRDKEAGEYRIKTHYHAPHNNTKD